MHPFGVKPKDKMTANSGKFIWTNNSRSEIHLMVKLMVKKKWNGVCPDKICQVSQMVSESTPADSVWGSD